VHFGIVLLVNVGIGALTPPMGMLVFITSAITGESVSIVFKAMAHF